LPHLLPQLLEDIGALDERERLTSLGRHLAALPLPPALGKMLLYACLFGCLDPVLTVACCMAYRLGRERVHAWPGCTPPMGSVDEAVSHSRMVLTYALLHCEWLPSVLQFT
jgi:HrpA-like RNA helicase